MDYHLKHMNSFAKLYVHSNFHNMLAYSTQKVYCWFQIVWNFYLLILYSSKFFMKSTIFFPNVSFIFSPFSSQVIGSIVAVSNILEVFPEVHLGPRLNIDIHQGALREGILTFVIVIISLGLRRKTPTSFFIKTWISGVFKLTIHILGSDLYGGCMNPASVSALM